MRKLLKTLLSLFLLSIMSISVFACTTPSASSKSDSESSIESELGSENQSEVSSSPSSENLPDSEFAKLFQMLNVTVSGNVVTNGNTVTFVYKQDGTKWLFSQNPHQYKGYYYSEYNLYFDGENGYVNEEIVDQNEINTCLSSVSACNLAKYGSYLTKTETGYAAEEFAFNEYGRETTYSDVTITVDGGKLTRVEYSLAISLPGMFNVVRNFTFDFTDWGKTTVEKIPSFSLEGQIDYTNFSCTLIKTTSREEESFTETIQSKLVENKWIWTDGNSELYFDGETTYNNGEETPVLISTLNGNLYEIEFFFDKFGQYLQDEDEDGIFTTDYTYEERSDGETSEGGTFTATYTYSNAKVILLDGKVYVEYLLTLTSSDGYCETQEFKFELYDFGTTTL